MCDPVTIGVATFAVEAGGAIISAQAQNKKAKANKKAALADEQQQTHDLSLRALEEKIAANQAIDQGNRQAAAVEGDTRAAAAANGVGGMTVDLLLANQEAQRLGYGQAVRRQEDANLSQIDRAIAGVHAEANNRIAGTPRANPFATGLQIAGAGLDGYGAYLAKKPKGV